MARIKIELPGNFLFTCEVPIRITDINYGGHVGNDTLLTILHEVRMQFLHQLGYTEMNFSGCGMIMADVAIEFKHELFYGDRVIASVAAGEISRIGFDLYYKLEKETAAERKLAAVARTGMICFDYKKRKIVSIPAEAKTRLRN